MGAPWETFAPWEAAAVNYVNKVGGAARNLYNTAKTSAPWETAVGLGQTALEAGSGTLKALNTAANDLIPGDKKALQKQIDTDPVMNYHATTPTGKAATGLLGEVAAPVGGAAGWANNQVRRIAGEGAAATLADIVTLATGKQAIEKPDVPVSEMTTYHGTPHVFKPTEKNELGEFKLSQVGTGEGAQAYGHGIYVAQSKETGNMYRAALNDWKPKGVEYEKGSATDRATAYAAEQKDAGAQNPALSAAHNAQKFLDNADPQKKAIVKQLKDWHANGQEFERGGSLYHVDVPDEHVEKMLDWDKPLHEQTPEVQRALTSAMGGQFIKRNASGFSNGPYTMRQGSPLDVKRIKDDLELTAENDRSLVNEEGDGIHPDVQKAIDDYHTDPNNDYARDQLNEFFHDYPYDKEQFGNVMDAMESEHGVPAGELYKALVRHMGTIEVGDEAARASEYLKSQGVPGIKYLDAGSRGRADMDTTRNLVLFDPSIANIIKRE